MNKDTHNMAIAIADHFNVSVRDNRESDWTFNPNSESYYYNIEHHTNESFEISHWKIRTYSATSIIQRAPIYEMFLSTSSVEIYAEERNPYLINDTKVRLSQRLSVAATCTDCSVPPATVSDLLTYCSSEKFKNVVKIKYGPTSEKVIRIIYTMLVELDKKCMIAVANNGSWEIKYGF